MAVDSMKPTVFCITEGGELLRWFDCANYMREPSDITIFGNEYYICDFKVRVSVFGCTLMSTCIRIGVKYLQLLSAYAVFLSRIKLLVSALKELQFLIVHVTLMIAD